MGLDQAPVLVVEDDGGTRELVREVLLSAGYEVVVACDGREALTLLDEIVPCVILVDLMMPVMGGFQFVSLLRARRHLSMVPVVLITGSGDQLPVSARHAFDRCLTKPVAPGELLELVAEFALRARSARVVLEKLDAT